MIYRYIITTMLLLFVSVHRVSPGSLLELTLATTVTSSLSFHILIRLKLLLSFSNSTFTLSFS